MATVLSSIKDYLAVNDTDAFDQEILMLVHSALSSLDQIGKVTIPSEITNSTTWESICQDSKLRPFVKNYVFFVSSSIIVHIDFDVVWIPLNNLSNTH